MGREFGGQVWVSRARPGLEYQSKIRGWVRGKRTDERDAGRRGSLAGPRRATRRAGATETERGDHFDEEDRVHSGKAVG